MSLEWRVGSKQLSQDRVLFGGWIGWGYLGSWDSHIQNMACIQLGFDRAYLFSQLFPRLEIPELNWALQ